MDRMMNLWWQFGSVGWTPTMEEEFFGLYTLDGVAEICGILSEKRSAGERLFPTQIIFLLNHSDEKPAPSKGSA